MSITDGRKRLFEIAREVQKPGVAFSLTENGKPTVAVMSMDELESWIETIEVMMEFPNLKKELDQAHREIASGKTITLEELKEKLDRKRK